MRQRVMIAMALCQRAQAADRRRAHHRARRDRAGADPGAAQEPPGAAGHGDHPDHPRPRRGRGHRRRDRGDVRRPDRGARDRRGDLPRSAAPLHLGSAEVDPAARRAPRRGARADLRPAAEPDQAPVGMPLPSPLPVRARAAQEDRPAARARAGNARPSGRLPAGVRRPVAHLAGATTSGEAAADLRREVADAVARAGRRHPASRVGKPKNDADRDAHRHCCDDDGRAAGRGTRPRQALPDQAGRDLPAPDRRGEGRRRRLVRRAQGRDAGDRRRDRLRKEHHGPAARSPARPDIGRGSLRGRGDLQGASAATSRRCTARCR